MGSFYLNLWDEIMMDHLMKHWETPYPTGAGCFAEAPSAKIRSAKAFLLRAVIGHSALGKTLGKARNKKCEKT
jgi:hypothetical protein